MDGYKKGLSVEEAGLQLELECALSPRGHTVNFIFNQQNLNFFLSFKMTFICGCGVREVVRVAAGRQRAACEHQFAPTF